MAEKCYFKIQPSEDAGEPCGGGGWYLPYPGFAEALKGEGAEYGPFDGSGGCSTGVLYPLRPDCTVGAQLGKVHIHYDYFMSRTSGSHNFSLRDVGIYSVHYGTYAPDLSISSGAGEISGTVHYELPYCSWRHLYPDFFEYARRLTLYFGQGMYAYGCYGKVGNFYILVEFTPATDLVTTGEAKGIDEETEKLKAEIKDITLGNYTWAGFEYYKDGDSGNVITTGKSGDFGEAEYTKTVDGLDQETKYHYRAKAERTDLTIYGEWKVFTTFAPCEIINIKAEPDSTQTAIKLYGEITEGENITEKGFEYIIQDEEPWAYEYEGNEVAFGDRLYRLSREEEYEHTTIWWFRAYCKIGEDKYTADSWMKNVPTVTTSECIEVGAQQAKGNGELTDKGANIVERLGFRIIKEYSGDLMGAQFYCNILSGFKVAEELEEHTLYDTEGIYIIGYYWTGIFYRDAFFPKSQTPGDFELGIYSYVLGGGFLGEEFGVYLKPNDTYKIQAIAKNDLGVGYGDDIFEVTTGQNFLYEEDEPIISPTSVEKSVTIRDIPEGSVATRVGIRLGRTSGCNEIDVFMDGEWGNGEEVTFFIPDLIPGERYYEEPYMVLRHDDIDEEIIDEEEETFLMEDLEEEDLDYEISPYEEINYKTIIREIKCEKIADQSIIDRAGRRRSGTITNHLIQDRPTCRIIINDYLNKFQTIKRKIEIDYDIPIPFEREDAILIDEGLKIFKADEEGEIPGKADGEGENKMTTSILTKIRKIDGNYISGIETILKLELEV